MQIRSFLIPLLLVSAVFCSSKRGLKIVLVNKYGLFEDRVQKSLESALKWFENAVLIEDFEANVKFSNERNTIEGYSASFNDLATIQTPNKLFSLQINSPEFEKLFETADHVIFIEQLDCPSPRPEAQTGSVRKSKQNIPKVAEMHWCYHPEAHEFSYFDFFRHEILHGLGYGTELRVTNSKKEEHYQWINEDGSVSDAMRHSIEFNEKVVEEVKKHFECVDVKGVEVDISGIHFNEYIFHNELMTPGINTGRNFFSWISVAILEQTYSDNGQVYFVNRSFVAPEADSYTYAKGFGCSWLFKSCHEFLSEKKSEDNPRPAPFCPEYERNSAKVKCFKNGNRYTPFDCRNKFPATVADNGISPPSNAVYQDPVTRFCPIYRHYDQFFMYPLVDCKTNKAK